MPDHPNARYSVPENFVELSQQHPGQANVVRVGWWRGHRVAIRTARQQDGSLNEFYIGVRALFGLHLQVPYHYRNMYAALRVHSQLDIPKLYSLFPYRPTAYQPTHAFVDGRAATTFDELSISGAKAYGRHLAAIHCVRVSSAGMVGTPISPTRFHQRLANTIESFARNQTFEMDDKTRQIAFDTAQALAELPPLATAFAPIMLDQDPTQYFIREGHFTHLIDLDFYVYGPPEQELIALEAQWPEQLAGAFVDGYRAIRAFPTLKRVRPHYRILNRLLCLQGRLPYATWHDRPTLFP
ncbi:hypothetical protein [Alicyclobacillus suci]|uniref:hypothetical protein n=1 Tax=Alicyclobacillus suci TaxID=2816080 RepID=UPI001A8F528A|nr:hypothetical protein [Alicyclobacillus suci]